MNSLVLYVSKCGDSVNKLIEVREFDSIIHNEDYENDYNHCISKNQFEGLITAIDELSVDKYDSNVLDFLGIRYRKNVGQVAYLKNYVGLIHLSDECQIQVLPKIDFFNGDDKGYKKTKEIFLKMIRSMKAFRGKIFNNAFLATERMNLYEIFISMYLQGVRKIVQKGLKSAYLLQEDNLTFCKGKLLINEHVKKNFAHKEKFYIAFDEFQLNRPENRLIKATLLKLRMWTRSLTNSKEIRQLLTAFDGVDASTNYENDFTKSIIDRNTKDYAELLKWSEVFLLNKSFTMFSGIVNAKAILFPMEKVFESYIAQGLKRIFSGLGGWQLHIQDRSYHLCTEPVKFSIRPDIVLIGNNKTVVMDTKWKRLKEEDNNYGISVSDMYQMYVYAKRYSNGKNSDKTSIYLLYPLTKETRSLENKDIIFKTFDGTIIRVFFVNVAKKIEESLLPLKDKILAEP